MLQLGSISHARRTSWQRALTLSPSSVSRSRLRARFLHAGFFLTISSNGKKHASSH